MRRITLRVQVRSFEAVCRAVEARLGVGVLPLNAARSFAASMRLHGVPLGEPWALRRMWLCLRGEPADGSPLHALVTQLTAFGGDVETQPEAHAAWAAWAV